MAERLGHEGLADADGAVEDHRLAGFDERAGGEVSDGGRGDLGVEGEVEVLQGGRLLEFGAADPLAQGVAVAAADLVLAQDLEELQVAQLPGAGLGQPGFQGVEHAAEREGAQGRLELVGPGHPATPLRSWSWSASAGCSA